MVLYMIKKNMDEFEQVYSQKQKEIQCIIDYRDQTDKMFCLEFKEKEIYLFLEKNDSKKFLLLTKITNLLI